MLNYQNIKSDRQWRSLTGLPSKKFFELCALFKNTYEKHHGISLSEGAANLKKNLILCTYEDCLFFVLYQLKNGTSYDVLGFHIGTDGSNALRMFEKYQKILEMTLFQSAHLPKRSFSTLKEFQAMLKKEEDIILDVTEVPIERKSDYEEQKKDYSGKKKKHTKKTLILTNKKRKIYYISKIHIGKEHDYSILKTEFPPNSKWFRDKQVRLDLGFQGFQDLYETKKTYIPIKKKKAKKSEDNSLTPTQIEINKEQAQERIYVEHSIGGMKRFKIIHHQIRAKLNYKIDALMGICAGLWNFIIT